MHRWMAIHNALERVPGAGGPLGVKLAAHLLPLQ